MSKGYDKEEAELFYQQHGRLPRLMANEQIQRACAKALIDSGIELDPNKSPLQSVIEYSMIDVDAINGARKPMAPKLTQEEIEAKLAEKLPGFGGASAIRSISKSLRDVVLHDAMLVKRVEHDFRDKSWAEPTQRDRARVVNDTALRGTIENKVRAQEASPPPDRSEGIPTGSLRETITGAYDKVAAAEGKELSNEQDPV